MADPKIATTQEGTVFRIIKPTGEQSWRWNLDGTWDVCGDHKGPWVRTNAIYVPAEVLRAAVQHNDACRERVMRPAALSTGE